MVTRLIVSILFVISSVATVQAKVMASVNKNPAIAGQPIVLSIEADTALSQTDLSLSKLKSKLDLGHISFSQSTQIINGDMSRSSKWTAVFYIDTPQTMTIGPFQVGDELTPPFELKVLPAKQVETTTEKPPVFLKSKLNSAKAYLGQVLDYELTLYLKVELQSGQLNTPDISGLTFTPVGEDSDAIELIDGQKYRVIQRHFSVQLNKTGLIDIPASIFNGNIIVSSQYGNSLFTTRNSRPIRVLSQPFQLEVLPPQSDFETPWIVADNLELTETWSLDEKSIEIGTPITRTIQLKGTNSDLELVEPLTMDLPSHVKSYPEKPKRELTMVNQEIVSTMTTSYAIVPRQAGDLIIPEVKLAWWDPKSQSKRWLTLPKKVFSVTALAVESAPPVAPTPSAAPAKQEDSVWLSIAVGLAALWLLTVGLGIFFYKRSRAPQTPKPHSTPANIDAVHGLESACQQGDLAAILQQTAPWFSQALNQDFTLSKLADLYPEMDEMLTQLQSACYSQTQPEDKAFDAMAYWNLCQKMVKPNTKTSQKTLASLYPV
jgi:hypothetical protein